MLVEHVLPAPFQLQSYCIIIIASTSWLLNRTVISQAVFQIVPLKQYYHWGTDEVVPLSRGFLHGFLAIVHACRAGSRRSAYHGFLVVQYSASFILHNAPLSKAAELYVARLDNYAIAAHVLLITLLGARGVFWKGLLWALFAFVIITSLLLEQGINGWAYKLLLCGMYLSGGAAWHASGVLYKPGMWKVAFMYAAAFTTFAAYKLEFFKGANMKLGLSTGDAVSYDCFHAIQATTTLAALHIFQLL